MSELLPESTIAYIELQAPTEKEQVSSMLACSFYGSPATIKEKVATLIEATGFQRISRPVAIRIAPAIATTIVVA